MITMITDMTMDTVTFIKKRKKKNVMAHILMKRTRMTRMTRILTLMKSILTQSHHLTVGIHMKTRICTVCSCTSWPMLLAV